MIDGNIITISTTQFIGLTGAGLYSVNFFLLAFDKLRSQSPAYYFMQFLAASLVLVSLTQAFNMASVVIQVFFIVVSVAGVLRHLRVRAKTQSRSNGLKKRLPKHRSIADRGFRRAASRGIRASRPFARPNP